MDLERAGRGELLRAPGTTELASESSDVSVIYFLVRKRGIATATVING